MNFPQPLRRRIGLAALALAAATAPLQAQNLNAISKRAVAAMESNDWPTALAELTRATDAYDSRAKTLYGPSFGWFWYRRGIAELKLGKHEDAANSFAKSYTDYKNTPDGISRNMTEKMAILYHGHAAKAAGQYKENVELYSRFLKERDPKRDKVNYGIFHTNRAYSYFKLGKFAEGVKDLELAIENKDRFQTTNKSVMQAFVAMAESAIKKKNESVLLQFLDTNRGYLTLAPIDAVDFAPLFMKLANDAKQQGLMRSTFEFYSLVPSTVSAIDNGNALLSQVGQYPGTVSNDVTTFSRPVLSEKVETLEAAEREGAVNEIYAMLNTASMHEQDGNTRGAFGVFEQLERYFPNAKVKKDGVNVPMRETNLYNLVRTASSIGEVLTTEKYGNRFLKAFPTSKYVPEVQRMMLTSLFWNGEYDLALKVGERLLPELAEGTKEHDVCLFVVGGSRFYSGRFVDAQDALDAHVRLYPEADEHRRRAALYFQASNLTRLAEWDRAGALLDGFLKAYPDPKKNLYYPFALFDRANVHYSVDEIDQCLTNLNRIEKEFQGVALMEQVYNLKGNALEQKDQLKKAEEYHKKALILSEKKENKDVAAEALYHLVRLIGDPQGGKNKRMKEALTFYDKFWEEHQGTSNYEAQVAVAGLPAMVEAGRSKEALEKMRGVIVRLSSNPENPELEKVINSYTEAYLVEHSPDELKDHYYTFPGIDQRDAATRALLRIAIINVYEDVAAENEGKDAAKVSAAQAQIKVLFNELRSDFDTETLSPYILVSLGNFLVEKTTAPKQAVPYFKAALKRDGHDYKFNALFGLAKTLSDGSKADQRQAVEFLRQVISSSDDRAQKEDALFKIIEVLEKQKAWNDLITEAFKYLKDQKNRKYTPLVRLALGNAYDQSGRREDAITVLAQVWATNMGYVKVSGPAILRWMELVWDRNSQNENGKSDRQLAYDNGFKYVELTEGFQAKLKPAELKIWNKVRDLVETYGARADVIDMATQKAGAEK